MAKCRNQSYYKNRRCNQIKENKYLPLRFDRECSIRSENICTRGLEKGTRNKTRENKKLVAHKLTSTKVSKEERKIKDEDWKTIH